MTPTRARSNDNFREAVAQRESEDAQQLQAKLKRALSDAERGALGVSQLRGYLERLLQRRYLESVPLIVPLLEQEFRTAVRAPSVRQRMPVRVQQGVAPDETYCAVQDQRLQAVVEELEDLTKSNLKVRASSFNPSP